jgi:hypothetical protein
MHLFDVTAGGWLRFRPFRRYELPVCRPTEPNEGPEKAPFFDKRAEKVIFHRRLWRLEWPGETDRALQVQVPASIVMRWPAWEEDPSQGQSHYSIGDILDNNWLPPDGEIPETIAYFLAVNYRYLGFEEVRYGVCGLPAARVQQVVDARFAVHPSMHSTMQYLKWMAEGHRHHPLFTQFGSNFTDALAEVNHTFVSLYFHLLGDHLYDPESRWWARHDKKLWTAIATYLHWVGRTGTGLYDTLSRLSGDDWLRHNAQKGLRDAPDLDARLKTYLRGDMDRMRNYSHTHGDPCQADPDDPPTGPSLGESPEPGSPSGAPIEPKSR